MRREADETRELTTRMERLLHEYGRGNPSIETETVRNVTFNPRTRIAGIRAEPPAGWIPAGATPTHAPSRNLGVTEAEGLEFARANRPSQPRKENVPEGRDGHSREPAKPGKNRPPRYIRQREIRLREQAEERERGRQEGRRARLERENRERREREAEEAYQRRQRWVATYQEEKRLLREEATAAAEAIVEEVFDLAWESELEAENRRRHFQPALVDTAFRRMWCRKCEKRGHHEKDCPETD